MSIINNFLSKLFGNKSDKDIKTMLPIVNQINTEFEKIKTYTNDKLRALTQDLKKQIRDNIQQEHAQINEIKEKIQNSETNFIEKEKLYNELEKLDSKITKKTEEKLNEILPTAFAIIKDTARRFKENTELTVTATEFDKTLAVNNTFITIENDKAIYKNRWIAGGNEIIWDMIHYDVQLIGGVVLHHGKIAEMATGEGKTLVASLPIFLNAIAGKGVHLVTVNNYLAKRDAEWNGPLFQFHGLSVDCIDKYPPNSKERKKAYNCDITFGTNNEFGFDYLRDNMVHHPDELVQRKHNYVIIDEVDSVLVDEARTPLIISGPVGKTDDEKLFMEFKPKVKELYDTQKRLITSLLSEAKKHLLDKNDEKGGMALLRAHKGLPANRPLVKLLSEQGNKQLLQKTENIYLAENEKRMHEVTDELYFVINEKQHSVELTDKGIDLITGKTDDPEFFIIPDVGTKIAEIEQSNQEEKIKIKEKEKLLTDHAIKTERIHAVGQLVKAYAMFEKDVDYVVMDRKVKIVDEQTGRILDGRRYSEGLHQAIEAKENVKIEETTQTYATITLQNYFRMYNKIAGMTGTAETEAQELWDIYKLEVVVIPTNKPIVRFDHEGLIYKTKREKYKAVIKEITKLRQQQRAVLVGTTSVEVSEILSKMLGRKIKHNVLNAKLHQKEADIVAYAGQPGAVTIATNMAGRGTDIKLHPKVKKAGGLAIIGTERHESRRVDRQLRGRSGRQGDPGSSQFFVSIEDDLMRIFGTERIAKAMDIMKLQEGEVIQHKMITKSIERAQKKVEENNFGIRKRLLEYDDVMNSQREVIYSMRKNTLFGEKLDIELSNMIYDICKKIVDDNFENHDYEYLKFQILKTFSFELDITEDQIKAADTNDLTNDLHEKFINLLKQRLSIIKQQLMPIIEKIYLEQAATTKIITAPIADGFKIYNVASELKLAYENKGKEVTTNLQKIIMLISIDEVWKEHLREMDALKQAVHSASYEQKDPLLIYKGESFDLFQNMLEKLNNEIITSLFRAHVYRQEENKTKKQRQRKVSENSAFNFNQLKLTRNENLNANTKNEGNTGNAGTRVRTEKKIGNNDPCPCGSGKKYKACCKNKPK